jgi:hypothetical protein
MGQWSLEWKKRLQSEFMHFEMMGQMDERDIVDPKLAQGLRTMRCRQNPTSTLLRDVLSPSRTRSSQQSNSKALQQT